MDLRPLMASRWDLGAQDLSWLDLGPDSGREHPRNLGVVLKPVNKKLLALFVGEFPSVARGLVEVSERLPPQTPSLTILEYVEQKVA